MARIILEDIRTNKKPRVTPKKEEVSFVEIESAHIEIKEKIIKSEPSIFFKNKQTDRQRIQRTPQINKSQSGFNRYILFFLILSLCVGLTYWISIIFQRADIIITAKHQIVSYDNKQFNILKESNGSTDDIMIMIYTDQKSKNITLTEPKEVSIKAKGTITLYNEFGTNPQKLLAGTFISDNEGKSYKTEEIINIPGYKVSSDNKIIPGEVEANISAFLPGETYNGSPTDFFIASFKGTAKYNKIYGKLKSPFTGGASGIVYTIGDSDITNIDNMAKTTFKNDLIKKVEASIYPGYILYPNAMTFSYKIKDNFFSKTPETKIIVDGVLSVVLLKEKTLMDSIIKVSLPKISNEELREIKINNINNLSFNFTNKEQLISKEMSSVSFYLSGEIDVEWIPDVEILKTKLLGVSKTEVPNIFKLDPGISSASVNIFPPWQKNVPGDLSKIDIILK